ncbi:MAG: hypothetical protein DRJ03_01575 [Chloroflexi bacterium]|nr:MAG: hypothetical protein DRJ03_01575 [Chloroflexota bacterium]
MSHEEVDALKELVRELPYTPTIIQIGAERGCSTVAMLEERPLAFILSIDIGERPEERANVERAELDHRQVVRALGRSQDIGLWWPMNWECDMLFIDGDHRYEGVSQDLYIWADKIKPGGILALHDYIEDPIPAHIKGRVAHAVRDWLEKHDEYEEIARCQRLIAFQKKS